MLRLALDVWQYIYIYIYIYIYTHTHTHTHIYIHEYILCEGKRVKEG